MKFILEVNNKTKRKISKKFFLDIFKCTIKRVAIDFFENKTLQLSIAIVEEEEMHSLNQQYRKKNKPTDVLSFFEYQNVAELIAENEATGEENIFIGEIILCPSYIERNAKEDGETFEYALTYIVSHGVLHLLGYPHGKKMFTLQRSVANELTA